MARLDPIANTDREDRIGDVIFVHGLGGDGRTTWQRGGDRATFWPEWVGRDLPTVGVWSVDFDASPSLWFGSTMPLSERARNILDLIEQEGDGKAFGDRPLVFVVHSLGGLVVKQMLRSAASAVNDRWNLVAARTRGILFLSTPHFGANLANWIQYLRLALRTTISVEELRRGTAPLQDLNQWCRDQFPSLAIKARVYYESRPTTYGRLLARTTVHVVDRESADPGLAGTTPVPLDADHESICRPPSTTDAPYPGVLQFVRECLAADPSAASSEPEPRRATLPAPTPAADVADALPAAGGYRYDAFISFADDVPDADFARNTLRELEATGLSIAVEGRDFMPGRDRLDEIERCIRESRFTLAVISPHFMQSGSASHQARVTKVRDMEDREHRLIPLIIEPATLPVWLRSIVGIDFTEAEPLVPPMERLKQALFWVRADNHATLGSVSPPSQPAD